MSDGQGFVRRVSRENLALFAPLLKRPRMALGGMGNNTIDEDQANSNLPDRETEQAEMQFDGESLSFNLPHRRRSRGMRTDRRRRQEGTDAKEESLATPVGSFELLWQSKPLTRRDLTIPDEEGTHQTGSINLDKGLLGPGTDHRHYFRDEVFADLTWEQRSATVIQAVASFQLVVMGTNRGEFSLPIRHTTSTTSRAYQQRNAMTRLGWGRARQHVTDSTLIGRTLSLYRDISDPTRFRLEIA